MMRRSVMILRMTEMTIMIAVVIIIVISTVGSLKIPRPLQ